jgi:chemotaxis protein CheD
LRNRSRDNTELVGGESYYLEQGYIYFSKTAVSIRTVVGSCVAVCIWDRALRYGGMNHFLHPSTRERENATAQYGNVATAALVRAMEEAGSKRGDLMAQIVGGGAPDNAPKPTIGQRNVQVARGVLARKGIPILSEDVGGAMGRKVIFDTTTGECLIIKVHRLRESDWLTG